MTSEGDESSRLTRGADILPLTRAVWRGHRRRYGTLDDGGARRKSARFHRAPDLFLPAATWSALYTALDLAVTVGEIQRGVQRQDDLDTYRFTEIWVQLESVLDCRDLARFGIRFEDLFADFDYSLGQALAAEAVLMGVEGLLVPSATRLGDNLIIFPHLVRRGSVIVEVSSIDPALVKHWPEEFP